MKVLLFAALFAAVFPFTAAAASAPLAPQATIRIPGGGQGIGFDDIGYAAQIGRVTVPAGATGNLVLIDPKNDSLTTIPGVTRSSGPGSAHEEGTTSAVYADGFLIASDHDPAEVVILNPGSKTVVERTALEGGPDYVRFVASRHEVWVTEPGRHQIQVFRWSRTAKPMLSSETVIPIPGGPESLVIDNQRGLAYTNQWSSKTVEISLSTHRVLAEWPNTCTASRGLALDSAHDHLFVACSEGKAVTLSPVEHGKVLASALAGAGIDIISYSPRLHHLYVPGARAATLTIFDASAAGALKPVALYKTAKGAHCVTDDNGGNVFVCDPHAGTILAIRDR